MESLQGRALVASPYLTDSHFMRTVVYIIRHDDEGAMGLVLNRPMEITIGQLLGELTEMPIENSNAVYYGGPVDGPVMMLQARQCTESDDRAELLIACDQSKILEVMREADGNQFGLKLFDGYSGWGPGQLEGEMREGSWLVWDIGPYQLFHAPETLWQEAVLEIGRDVLSSGLGISRLSASPDEN